MYDPWDWRTYEAPIPAQLKIGSDATTKSGLAEDYDVEMIKLEKNVRAAETAQRKRRLAEAEFQKRYIPGLSVAPPQEGANADLGLMKAQSALSDARAAWADTVARLKKSGPFQGAKPGQRITITPSGDPMTPDLEYAAKLAYVENLRQLSAMMSGTSPEPIRDLGTEISQPYGRAAMAQSQKAQETAANPLGSSAYGQMTSQPIGASPMQQGGGYNWGRMAQEAQLEALKRLKLGTEAMERETPQGQEASAYRLLQSLKYGPGGEIMDIQGQKAAEAGGAAQRAAQLGGQQGIDEALLSPMGAHAAAVRQQYLQQQLYGKAAGTAESAAQRGMWQYLQEQIKQQGAGERNVTTEMSRLLQSYNQLRRVLQNQGMMFTDQQRQTAAQQLEQVLAEMDRLTSGTAFQR